MCGEKKIRGRMIQDLKTEQAVLAGIYKHGKNAFVDVTGIVTSGTFSGGFNQTLFACYEKAFEKSERLDYPTLMSVAHQLGHDETLTREQTKLASILEMDIELKNVSILGKRIARLHLARQGQSKLREAMSAMELVTGDETATSILSIIEKPGYDLQKILNSKSDEGQLIGAGAVKLVERLLKNQNRELGILTGNKEYDNAIGGGIRRKGFALIGARRKIGKSALAANIALYIAQKLKIPVLYLDTEMDAEQHQYRLLANLTGIPIKTIERSTFAGNKMFVNQLQSAAAALEKLPITHEIVSGKDFKEILAIARRWAIKTVGYHPSGKLNNCIIIYDYFKLMDPASLKHLKEYEAIGYQATELSNFCIEMDLPCLAFVQLNRDLDISQSDRLSWLATSVCLFMEKTPEEVQNDGIEYGNRKIVFDVARFGEGLDKDNYINVQFDGNFCKIAEIGTAYEMKQEKQIGKSGFKTKEDNLDGDDAPF